MDRPGRRVIRPVGIFVAQSNRCQWQPCRSSGRGKAEEGVLLIQLDCPSPRKVDFVQRLKAAILGFVGSVRSTSSIWQNNRLDMHSRCHRRRRTAGSRNRRSSPRRRHSCGIYHAFALEFGRFAMRHTRRATALEQSSIQTNEPCRTKTFRATRQRS